MTSRYPHLTPLARLHVAQEPSADGVDAGLEEAPNGFERMAAFYAERARGEAGLIVTGGFAPNERESGAGGAMLTTEAEAERHRVVTRAVHAEGGKIALQILHFARVSPGAAPSALKAPINPFTPHALTSDEVDETIADFVRCAALAQQAVTTASRSWGPKAI